MKTPTAAHTLNEAGSAYIFCQHTSSVLDTIACDGFLWNDSLYTQSRTYYDTIPNATGCDSLMTLNLTINTVIIRD